MLHIEADKAVLERLAALLDGEGPDACLRLREYVLGGG